MRESSSTAPAKHEPYMGCADCDGYPRYEKYWEWQSMGRRNPIARPLLQSITNRIPPELIKCILDCLLRETRDLYNCALCAMHGTITVNVSCTLMSSSRAALRMMLWCSFPCEMERSGNTSPEHVPLRSKHRGEQNGPFSQSP